MVLRFYVFLALLTLVVSSACGGGDSPTPTVARPTATEQPEATPAFKVHPRGTRTGRPFIDAVLDAVERQDASRLTALLSFVTRPCATTQGSVIVCGPQQPDGTMLDLIAYGRCDPRQSQIVLRSDASAAVSTFMATRPSGLVAVSYVETSPYYAFYGISYASGHVVLLDDVGVTTLLPPCPEVGAFPRPLGERHILAPP